MGIWRVVTYLAVLVIGVAPAALASSVLTEAQQGEILGGCAKLEVIQCAPLEWCNEDANGACDPGGPAWTRCDATETSDRFKLSCGGGTGTACIPQPPTQTCGTRATCSCSSNGVCGTNDPTDVGTEYMPWTFAL